MQNLRFCRHKMVKLHANTLQHGIYKMSPLQQVYNNPAPDRLRHSVGCTARQDSYSNSVTAAGCAAARMRRALQAALERRGHHGLGVLRHALFDRQSVGLRGVVVSDGFGRDRLGLQNFICLLQILVASEATAHLHTQQDAQTHIEQLCYSNDGAPHGSSHP